MCEVTKGFSPSQRSPLLPDRHPQRDLFVCDIVDAVPKGDMSSMENPVFALSTKPDMRTRRYERGENWIQIAPSRTGLATVHDRDVLIYCINQCMAALNDGRTALPFLLSSLRLEPNTHAEARYLAPGWKELCLNLGDAHHQAARFSVSLFCSIPSVSLIPSMTFGN